ncbi:MAG: hypothetical protein BWY77_01879 [bacterium ADurb.Bin431]|nr:MAG: hypothetical protein BWY77_01879 [bacterium ADurb.Bin431]
MPGDCRTAVPGWQPAWANSSPRSLPRQGRSSISIRPSSWGVFSSRGWGCLPSKKRRPGFQRTRRCCSSLRTGTRFPGFCSSFAGPTNSSIPTLMSSPGWSIRLPGGFIPATIRPSLRPGASHRVIPTCRIFRCARTRVARSGGPLSRPRVPSLWERTIRKSNYVSWRQCPPIRRLWRPIAPAMTFTAGPRPGSSELMRQRLTANGGGSPRPSILG